MQLNAPRITHTVAVLLIGLILHTEDPAGVINTISIFMFPYLYLSVGSQATMIDRCWDTALDSNVITLYANTSDLMTK